MRIFFNSRHTRSRAKTLASHEAGFSLIELLVSIAIIGIISTVVLARYKSFNSTILLRDLAYEIALSVREAQVYGISVRSRGGLFNLTYGTHFAPGTTYTLFSDANNNDQFNGGIKSPGIPEEVAIYTIGQNNSIMDLCATTSAKETCGLRTLDVLFKRPDPDALFYAVDSSGARIANVIMARVVVGPQNDASAPKRIVVVRRTGQISIE